MCLYWRCPVCHSWCDTNSKHVAYLFLILLDNMRSPKTKNTSNLYCRLQILSHTWLEWAGVKRCSSYLCSCDAKITIVLNFNLDNKLIILIPRGRGNGTVVSVSVCQAGGPGSLPAQYSACHRKVEFYHCVIDSPPPVPTTGSKQAVHVSCLCNDACKRSLAICRKSRASCSVSRLLSVPYLACMC